MQISQIATENYLKSIVKFLSESDKDIITTGELAKLLHVTPGTVTSMAKKLEKEGYIEYQNRIGCSLTEKGKKYGLNILRRHRLIETFLFQTLKMDWKDVHNEAENLEHAASDILIDKIDKYLGKPKRDPHGAVIPKKNQKEYTSIDLNLNKAACGIEYSIARLTGSEAQFEYYKKINLKLNSKIILQNKNEESGLAEIIIDENKVSCSTMILKNIFVEKIII
ncbi:metal-dependent transcriptional regulator [Treponema sp. OMZ 792]|uniref:metal-dependent transcriptional regulator n=1 Tax=unclassified Treponema TaxID=2638727 RepID=UPI0020A27F64|nr:MULTISPECIES: metal-dependent transcriptional regulator [unclassified Treponema]UTC74091.1 metal-dependent transcriptional regulator [Treponema sp. OMZ 792]UTC77626.1 metal-dependent transcriptional regulator [Treponema sp. OMZ 799]UTC80491.1 metal-dependent transcriptional regulator [Treponema sp. OMZ 798]